VKSKETEWRECDAQYTSKLHDYHAKVTETLDAMHEQELKLVDSARDAVNCRREYLILEKKHLEEEEILCACNAEMKKTLDEWMRKECEELKELTEVSKKHVETRFRKAQNSELECRKEQKKMETALTNHRVTAADKARACAEELDRLKGKCERLKKFRALKLEGLAKDASYLRQQMK